MRTYVVSGASSGIGEAATAELRQQGHRVVTLDRDDGADINLDLSEAGQRATIGERVSALGVDVVDGVLPAAGLSTARSSPEEVLTVNFFGAIDLVRQLRTSLAASVAPRVCLISSIGLLAHRNDHIVELCLADDLVGACAALASDPGWSYEVSKRAVSTWVRRSAVDPEWLGDGIVINAIAPGLIATAMSAAITSSPEALKSLFESYPHPRGPGRVIDVARLAAFMLSAENSFMVGQTVFLDGGHEAVSGPEDLPLLARLPTSTASQIRQSHAPNPQGSP